MTKDNSNSSRKGKYRFEADLPPEEEKNMVKAKKKSEQKTDRGLLNYLIGYFMWKSQGK